MPNALIVGAFGQHNPGDEALLAASVRAVRASSGWEPVVATARPRATTVLLDVATVPATVRATARAASTADALVVGGGTVFKELHPASGRPSGSLLARGALLARSMALRGRPVVLLGVGAAPIARARNRRLARVLAASADLVVLRDEESARLLAGMGVPAPLRVGADLSWLALGEAPPSSGQSPSDNGTIGLRHGVVGVAISHLAGGPDVEDRLTTVVATVVEGGRVVELEPWQGSPRLGADALVAHRIAARVGPGARVVSPPADIAEAASRAGGRTAVVAQRFHAAVASAAARRPFVAVAHEPKLAAIAQRMGQVSVPADASASALLAALDAALSRPGPCDADVARELGRADAMSELLALVLTGEADLGQLGRVELVPPSVSSTR